MFYLFLVFVYLLKYGSLLSVWRGSISLDPLPPCKYVTGLTYKKNYISFNTVLMWVTVACLVWSKIIFWYLRLRVYGISNRPFYLVIKLVVVTITPILAFKLKCKETCSICSMLSFRISITPEVYLFIRILSNSNTQKIVLRR